jgi:ATP-dependent DNA helicase RecG
MSSIRVDRALAESPTDRAGALLSLVEDQWHDRKSIRVRAGDLAKALVAFANAEGGTVIIGVSRDAETGIEDIDESPKQINDLMQAGIDHTEPPVRTDTEFVECETELGVRRVMVMRVAPGERVHRLTNGECYLRVGDESRRLSYDAERELLFDRGQSQYDGEPASGVGLEDLDSTALDDFAEAIGHPTRDPVRVLNARSLLTPRGQVTNAAYLLFGQSPQLLFPQAFVRVLHYTSDETGTGSRQTIDAGGDMRFEGTIPSVIDRAQRAIERLVPSRRALTDAGRFGDVPLVPRDAWLEGLVNAVVHRSYSLAGDHVRVSIFPKRIEIESPGRFPGLVDVDRPTRIARFARNPRIARVCADLRITQELGEGIRRMFEEMQRAGLDDPLYRQTAGSVRLTLTSNPRLDPRLVARLPAGSLDALRLIENTDRQLGTGDVAAALGISRPTAVKRLNALRDEGLISWHGNSPRDPRAYWSAPGVRTS